MKNTLKSLHPLALSFASLLFLNGKLNAQAGVGPAPYCMPLYAATSIPCNQPGASNTVGNTINDFIDSFNTTGATVNITDNNNGCQTQILGGVQQNYFFKGCPTYLRTQPGQVVTCNFRSGITYDQGFAVFIDWNQNSVFDVPAERVAAVAGLPLAATWCTAAFTTPVAQANGTYRMRVRCAYVTSGGLIDPCLQYTFGETQDYYVIIGGTCAVLPIELVTYEGNYIDNQVILNWSTASELNSEYFKVERSYDNENFTFIGKIDAAGKSNDLKSYKFIDKGVQRNGIAYYRLQQYDKGELEPKFSRTIAVYTNNSNLGFDVYPNPANTEIKIAIPDALFGKIISVGVYNNTGRKVLESKTVVSIDNSHLNFNISELDAGSYFIKINDENGTEMKKIFIKK